jgi:hypothetical protein
MENFLLAFWPNFAATFTGILIGVPIALYLNARSIKVANKNRLDDELVQLTHGLDAVVLSLNHNEPLLIKLITTVESKQPIYDTSLNLSAWEACREMIVPYLNDAELSRLIAYHFERLASVARLASMHLDWEVGVASAVGGSEKTRDALAANIVQSASLLIADTVTLRAAIKNAQKSKENNA